MKEYKVECKAVNSDEWWTCSVGLDNINEAYERVAQGKKYDTWYKKFPEDWEYRILVREVPDWEVYTEGM